MELTTHQIDSLFAFTERKMVRWYDLQVEIVDHLAAKIEEEMLANKNLSFEAALNKVYASFGIFGFAKIVQEREKSLYSLGKKNFFKKMLEQISWPTMLRTSCIFLIVYLATSNLSRINLAYLGGFIMIAGAAALLYRDKVLYKMKKKLMMLYNPFDFISTIFFQLELQILFGFIFDNKEYANEKLNHPILYALIFSICAYAFIAQFNVKNDLKNEAKRLYPRAFA